MTHHHHDMKMISKPILLAIGLMVGVVMIITAVGRTTGVGTVRLPDAEVSYQVEVHFEDRGAEGVDMIDAATGELITSVPAGEDGFVRGVLRGMNRTRHLEGLGREAPYRFVRWSDGRISIADTATGHRIELRGFGKTNLHAFTRLIAAAEDRT